MYLYLVGNRFIGLDGCWQNLIAWNGTDAADASAATVANNVALNFVCRTYAVVGRKQFYTSVVRHPQNLPHQIIK